MRVMPAAAFLTLLAALGSTPASAQTHDHEAGGNGAIAHDVPPNGDTYVGALNHFGVLVLGEDDVPDFHQDLRITVTLNGATVMETTQDSGHDYDGVNLFDVTFAAPGSYMVMAYDGDGALVGHFNGTVYPMDHWSRAVNATLQVDAPEAFLDGIGQFTYSIRGPDGAILPHTDAWFEVRRGDDLHFRTKTHTHEAEQSLAVLAPAEPFTVRITAYQAYPSAGASVFKPIVWEEDFSGVTVPPGVMPVTPTPPEPFQPDAPLENAVETGTNAGQYKLLATYDPWTTVGPDTQMHLNAIVMDPAARAPVQHVDFEARLYDMRGNLFFSSDTLHEYDGIYEMTALAPVGEYVLAVDAQKGDWTSHVDIPYTVVPPVLPATVGVPPSAAAGPMLYSVQEFQPVAGQPFELDIQARNLAGQPFSHSEIDYVILEGDVPVQAGKLHTHDDGDFQLTAALPAGDYAFWMSPFPLEPQPVAGYSYGPFTGSDMSMRLQFEVKEGPGFPAAPDAAPTGEEPPAEEMPVPLTAVLAGLAVALLGG
jgi:hypothetical protein